MEEFENKNLEEFEYKILEEFEKNLDKVKRTLLVTFDDISKGLPRKLYR